MTATPTAPELLPTEAMCKAARWFILARDAGIYTWGGLIPGIPNRPTIKYIEDKIASEPAGHITKWDVADCIWQLMETARPQPTAPDCRKVDEAVIWEKIGDAIFGSYIVQNIKTRKPQRGVRLSNMDAIIAAVLKELRPYLATRPSPKLPPR